MKSPTIYPLPRWVPPLVLLMALGGILRLINLNAPPLDFHPTRQLRNALVARAIYYESRGDQYPRERALADSFRRAVGQYEPPIIEALVGRTFLLTGEESFAVVRVYGAVFWLIAGLALFDMARRTASVPAALVALGYYLVLPFAVQASRSFQPDPLMTAAFVVGIYFFFRWGEAPQWRWAVLAGIFSGFAVLVKVVIAFLVAGAAIGIVLSTLGRAFWKSAQVWTMVALVTLPAAAYYVVGQPGRSTEYFFSWTVDLVRLITSPHFFADWLGFVGGLLGLSVIFMSLIGTCMAPRKVRWLLLGLWAGYLLYGLVLPFQMVTHSYYHLQLVPLVALGLVPVIEAVVEKAYALGRRWQAALLVPVFVLLGYQAWVARSVLVAEDFGAVPLFWESIGKAIPEDTDVIGLTQDYGFDLMYWGWRKVNLWPINTNLSALRNNRRDLAARFSEITAGNRYFLVTAFGQLESQAELSALLEGYAVAAQGDGYILYDLHEPK